MISQANEEFPEDAEYRYSVQALAAHRLGGTSVHLLTWICKAEHRSTLLIDYQFRYGILCFHFICCSADVRR